MFLMEVYHLGRFFFSLYQFSKGRPNRLVKYTKRCGPLAIKLIQFLLMREIIQDSQLEFTFENCDIHTFESTKEIIKRIEEDYLIDHVIASGSIGQVYLAYSKKELFEVAIKVKHPGIENSIHTFSKTIKILLYFFKTKYSPLITEYLENIKIQLDYTQEAKNTMTLKEKWKYNDTIVIPEIYNYSNDFIVMSYHEGTNYNDLSENDKTKTSIIMNFVVMESLLIHDFIHGDLHTGNWKVENYLGKMRIIIYDCGIVCKTGNLSFNKKVLSCILGGNFIDLLYLVNDVSPRVKQCEEYILKNLPSNSIERVRFFINTLLEWGLCRNKHLICILSAYALIGEISGSSSRFYTKYVGNDHYLYECLVYIYIGLLENTKIFGCLKQFLEQWMDSDPIHKEHYNSWLMERFGHTKGYILNTLIYQKIKIDF